MVGANTGGEGGSIMAGGSLCGTFGREGGAFGISVEGVGAEKATVREGLSRPVPAILMGDAGARELTN
jgi:hypothetical protein